MSFMDDKCDFCGSYMDPIGCDTKQLVGDKAWCGQCDISEYFSAGVSELERKAAAFDELQATMLAIERNYWNTLWTNHGLDEKVLAFRRHNFGFLAFEDARRRISAKYGLN